MACGLYDRMLDLYRGDVRPDDQAEFHSDGWFGGRARDFDRMAGNLEFDVAGMSSSEFVARKSAGKTELVALPVFPSRVFRHGMVTINRRSEVNREGPRGPAGRRADLYDERGSLDEGSSPARLWGRITKSAGSKAPSIIPAAWPPQHPAAGAAGPIEQNTSGKSLSDLLESGGIDAIIGTVLPDAIHRNPDIQRLFPNYREEEKNYYKRTRIFPIMHLIAMRRDVYEKHPFIASSLFDAMCESKERACKRMRDLGTLNYMLPWMTADIDELDEISAAMRGPMASSQTCRRSKRP